MTQSTSGSKALAGTDAASTAAAGTPRNPGATRSAVTPGQAVAPDRAGAVDGAVRRLLHRPQLVTAEQLPTVVHNAGRLLGASETVLYLADYEQAALIPLPGEGVPGRQELAIDRTVAGLAYRRVEVVSSPVRPSTGAGRTRLWVPLLDSAERLGVLELVVPDSVAETVEGEAKLFAALLAELITSLNAYSDRFAQLRRRRTLTLAAEIQWNLLPPLTYGDPRVVISGALEPAYEIGGDTFDYAVNGDTAHLLVLDAIGHGLGAALLAGAAVGAYRHTRRSKLDLPETAAQIDAVIASQFGPERFATAVIVQLDLGTGRLRWVNAGHPAPLVLRNGSLLQPPTCPPHLPLGLQEDKAQACELALQPGDRVLLYTDGVVEARSPTGEFFGEQRLTDFVLRSASAGYPPPETLRRLMREILTHQADQLQDDASIVILEWLTGDEQQLQL